MFVEEKFGERLAELRIKKGVSARDMSIGLGQSPAYINNIENKRSLPSMSLFLYICEYLEVTPADFFSEDNRNPEKINEAVEYLKKLSPSKLNNVLAVIKDLGEK